MLFMFVIMIFVLWFVNFCVIVRLILLVVLVIMVVLFVIEKDMVLFFDFEKIYVELMLCVSGLFGV